MLMTFHPVEPMTLTHGPFCLADLEIAHRCIQVLGLGTSRAIDLRHRSSRVELVGDPRDPGVRIMNRIGALATMA